MAKDPVCDTKFDSAESQRFTTLISAPDMEVDEEEAEYTTEYKGKTYYFCAPGCKTLFEEDPEEYLD